MILYLRSAAVLAAFLIAALGLTSCEDASPSIGAVEPSADISTMPSRVAITIDDLPYVMPSSTSPRQGLRDVQRIVAALAAHDITATGFVVGQQINDKSEPALRAFAEAGHTIGNHSWSHPDYGTLTKEQFRDETARTDRAIAPWITAERYYRFPFLREGETEAAKTAADAVLSSLGYQNVPVTIDNDEWQFNADYVAALGRGDTQSAVQIATAYIAHMQERTQHFQRLAQRELGADVDHILLIHFNRINADHLPTLLQWYADQGWDFISVKQAMAHPVFARPDRYAGPRGLSQIERVLGER